MYLGAKRRYINSLPFLSFPNKLYYTFHRDPVVLYADNGFMVKTNNLNVCQLGAVDDPPEIIFCNDVRMNLNRIGNLPAPTLQHEAVNKLYVNGMPRNIVNDYVPNLRSFCPPKNDKFGFIITASSYYSDSFHPVHAFNGLYRSGVEGDWNTKGKTLNLWIHIQCPDLVRLWRIALRGS